MRLRLPADIDEIVGPKVSPHGRGAHLDFRVSDPYASLYTAREAKSDVTVAEERIVIANGALNAITVTLPNPETQTLPVVVICSNADNAVTIASKGGALVGGSAALTLSTANTAVTLVPFGSAWYIAGRA